MLRKRTKKHRLIQQTNLKIVFLVSLNATLVQVWLVKPGLSVDKVLVINPSVMLVLLAVPSPSNEGMQQLSPLYQQQLLEANENLA